MTPRSQEQFANMRQSRKDSIMAAALKLFASKGVKDTSVEDIARDAEVSKGLMYNYFKSKDALVREIIIAGTHKMLDDLRFDLTKKFDNEQFYKLIEAYFYMIEQDRDYWRLYLATLSQPNVAELVKDDLFEILNPFFVALSGYYAEKGEKYPLAYSFLLGAIFDGIGMDYLFMPEEYPLAEIKEIIIEKFIIK